MRGNQPFGTNGGENDSGMVQTEVLQHHYHQHLLTWFSFGDFRWLLYGSFW